MANIIYQIQEAVTRAIGLSKTTAQMLFYSRDTKNLTVKDDLGAIHDFPSIETIQNPSNNFATLVGVDWQGTAENVQGALDELYNNSGNGSTGNVYLIQDLASLKFALSDINYLDKHLVFTKNLVLDANFVDSYTYLGKVGVNNFYDLVFEFDLPTNCSVTMESKVSFYSQAQNAEYSTPNSLNILMDLSVFPLGVDESNYARKVTLKNMGANPNTFTKCFSEMAINLVGFGTNTSPTTGGSGNSDYWCQFDFLLGNSSRFDFYRVDHKENTTLIPQFRISTNVRVYNIGTITGLGGLIENDNSVYKSLTYDATTPMTLSLDILRPYLKNTGGGASPANIGTGIGLYKNTTGTANFRSLKQGMNTSLVNNGDDITINFNSTTAGVTNRVYLNPLDTIVNSITYNTLTTADAGLTSETQTVSSNNTIETFATAFISDPYIDNGIVHSGSYTSYLWVNTDNEAQEVEYYIDVHLCDNLGANVSLLATLSSGGLILSDSNDHLIPLTATLALDTPYVLGQRIKFTAKAIKRTTIGGAQTLAIKYGLSHQSFIDVPVAITTDMITDSRNGQILTDSLNNLQPLDADLTAISALSGDGLLRKASGIWGMDTNLYAYASDLSGYLPKAFASIQTLTKTGVGGSTFSFDSEGLFTTTSSTNGRNIALHPHQEKILLNSDGFNNSLLFQGMSANRTWSFPNASGTLALTSQIPSVANYIAKDGTTSTTAVIPFAQGLSSALGVSITAPFSDGSALKIPDGSWIRPQTVGGGLFLTNGVDPSSRSRVHLVDSGFLAWGANATNTFGQFRMEEGSTTLIHYKGNASNSRIDLNDDAINLQTLGSVNSSLALGNTSASLFCGGTVGFTATPSGLLLGGVANGTIASASYLGLDASGYIVKSTAGGGGIAPTGHTQLTQPWSIGNGTTEALSSIGIEMRGSQLLLGNIGGYNPDPSDSNVQIVDQGLTVLGTSSSFSNKVPLNTTGTIYDFGNHKGFNSALNYVSYSAIGTRFDSNTSGSHAGSMVLQYAQAGALVNGLILNNSGALFNGQVSATGYRVGAGANTNFVLDGGGVVPIANYALLNSSPSFTGDFGTIGTVWRMGPLGWAQRNAIQYNYTTKDILEFRAIGSVANPYVLAIDSNGFLNWNGSAILNGNLQLPVGTATLAPLNIGAFGVTKTTPIDGDIWKSATDTLVIRMGTTNTRTFPFLEKSNTFGGTQTFNALVANAGSTVNASFTARQLCTTRQTSATSTGSISWVLSSGGLMDLTTALTGAITMNITVPIAGAWSSLFLTQGATVQNVVLSLTGVTWIVTGSNGLTSTNTITLPSASFAVSKSYCVQLYWSTTTRCYITIT